MKEVKVTVSLMVDENYSQTDIDDIVDGIKDMLGMTDPSEITFEAGEANFVKEE